jgi:hypothetical protein
LAFNNLIEKIWFFYIIKYDMMVHYKYNHLTLKTIGGIKMKKWLSWVLFLFFLGSVIFFWGCGGKKVDLKGSSALLTLIPEEAAGIFSINFRKLTKLDMYDKLIADMEKEENEPVDEVFADYQDFIDKTGIDPKTDLFALTVGMFGDIDMMRKAGEGGKNDIVVVIDLKYDPDKILNVVKSKAEKFEEEKYSDKLIYQFMEKHGQKMALAFINEQTIAFGKIKRVKQVIDLSSGKGKNILANKGMEKYLKELKSDSVLSFLFDFPEELKSSQQEGSPFKMDLSKAEAFLGYIDHDGSAWVGDIKLMSFDEKSNKEIVTMLNGLKGMGALAGPEVAELISNIQLTAEADHIKLSFSLSNELLEKLRDKAKEKKEGLQKFSDNEEEITE